MATTGNADSVARADAPALPAAKEALARLWAARSFFGGLTAIGLALVGQLTLMQNDPTSAQRYYAAAIILLILSLLHPSLHRRRSQEDVIVGARSEGQQTREEVAQVPLAQANAVSAALPVRPVRPNGQQASPYMPWVPDAGQAALSRQSEAVMPVAQASTGASEGSLWARWCALRARLGWRVIGPGLALTLALAGGSAFVLQKDITNPLGGWLWAADLVALVATFVGAPGWPRGEGLLPRPQSDFFARGLSRIPVRLEVILVAVVLLVAVALRTINLEDHPGIFGDEGERGMDARAINEGRPALLFGYGWWGVPNLYFYMVSFMLRIFGDNMVGDRMLSVISGVLAVLFVYLIGRLLWGARVGLIAGAMLAVSPLALQFSRLAGESSPTGTVWAIGFFFLVLALRHRRWSDWVLAGIAWGFSLYFYAAGKLIIPLFGLVGLYCLVRWRLDFFKKYALGFGLMVIAFALTAMPYLQFSVTDHWQGFTGRAQETSIFSPQNQAGTFARYGLPYDPSYASQPLSSSLMAHPVAWGQLLYQQMREASDVLYRRGDQVFFYRMEKNNGSMFSPLWAALALLGLAYAAWKFWDGRFGLASIWFWIGMSGSALTIDAPNLQRITGAWPVVMLFPALVLDRVFAGAWPLNLKLARKWATVPLVALLLYFGADSYQEYFVHFWNLCPYCDATTQARYAQALGQEYKGYQLGVGGYDVYFGYGSTRFVAKGVEGEDLLVPADSLPITDNNGKGAAFLVYANNADYLPMIRLFYPAGAEEVIKSHDGVAHFTSYKLTGEQITATQTVHATYQPQTGNPVIRNEPNIGTVLSRAGVAWSPPTGLSYPVQATWEGGLVAPTYGGYTFSVDANKASSYKLEIDGRLVLYGANNTASGSNQGQVEMVLAKGIHAVRFSANVRDEQSNAQLLWSSGSAPLAPIEARYLFNGPTGGLSGELGPFTGGQSLKADNPFSSAPPTTRRSDPFFGFRAANNLFTNAPTTARWQGTLTAPTEGDYAFSTNATGPNVILIDGQTVVENTAGAGGGPANGTAHLTVGPHAVDVRFAWPGGDTARFEWYWTPPGGQNALVPPTALAPLKRSWLRSELPAAPAAQIPQAQIATNRLKPDSVIGADAGLVKPRGVAVDKAGNIYVGDRGNHRTVVFSPDGKVIRTWGKEAAKGTEQHPRAGEFGDIKDVAVGGDGSVYVLEDATVQVFSSAGEFRTLLDPQALDMYGPNGIAVDAIGNVYIADTGHSRVLKLPPIVAGKPLSGQESLTGAEQNKLEQPVDAVAGSTLGQTYTIDLKDRIVQLGNAGQVAKQWQVQVGRDEGGSKLAVSLDGSKVYMSDPDRQRVAVLDVSSGAISYFGDQGGEAGQFGAPSGIAVGADGRVYVLDRVNHNVQVFTLGK